MGTIDVDAKIRKSLETTARKTYAIQIAASPRRPGICLLCVHAKEFPGVEGTELLVKYLRACSAIQTEQKTTCIFVDTNVPDDELCTVFGHGLTENGFQVLSPAQSYCTTQKTRTQMHGQFYHAKCGKTTRAHKDFVALFQRNENWKCPNIASVYPDLTAEPKDLPTEQWPSDHCMLAVE